MRLRESGKEASGPQSSNSLQQSWGIPRLGKYYRQIRTSSSGSQDGVRRCALRASLWTRYQRRNRAGQAQVLLTGSLSEAGVSSTHSRHEPRYEKWDLSVAKEPQERERKVQLHTPPKPPTSSFLQMSPAISLSRSLSVLIGLFCACIRSIEDRKWTEFIRHSKVHVVSQVSLFVSSFQSERVLPFFH